MKNRSIECGKTIPENNVHAVSVSLPSLADVIAYEEKDPKISEIVKSGYPRFVVHPYIKQIQEYLLKKYPINTTYAILSSEKALEDLCKWAGIKQVKTIRDEDIVALALPVDKQLSDKILSYLQHTGSIISSRRAEAFLISVGLLPTRFEEESHPGESESFIIETLRAFYNIPAKNITISNGGMNGIYASFRAINEIQSAKDRTVWIQFGWLYVDNIRILEKFTSDTIVISSLDINELESVLKKEGHRIAGLITEVPTNPLVQTPDLEKLKKLLDQYNVPVILDISIAGSAVIDTLSFADIIVESLTKFACGGGDVMLGAVICNPKSKYCEQLIDSVKRNSEIPYSRDLDRMGYEIKNYDSRMKKISANTVQLAEFFENHPSIKKVHWSYSSEFQKNYKKIERYTNAVGGVISIELNMPLQKFYDNLDLYKGPSFGTEFTLNMLYMYLAHYELVSTAEGRRELSDLGVDPELIRISVGTEDIEEIIKKYKEVLEK